MTLTLVLILLAIEVPAFQFSQNIVRGADPTYSVTIHDYYFQPAKVNITTGTTVVWTYVTTGMDYHTVTSDPGTNKTQNNTPLLNSGSMSPGQTFSFTFDQPGYYPYQCSFHPTLMNAWVNVTGSPVSPPPSQNPTPDYTLSAVVGAIVTIVVLAALVMYFRRKRARAIRSDPTSIKK